MSRPVLSVSVTEAGRGQARRLPFEHVHGSAADTVCERWGSVEGFVLFLATGAAVRIVAPLLAMSKADIIRRGTELGLDYSVTVSCYQADDDGRACGRCDSCRLRRDGFTVSGVPDPTRYSA